jgi:hypothetical protein
MPAQILHRGASINCSHAPPGKAAPISTFSRVTLSGQELVTLANQYSITDCPLNTPCATGQWISGAARVTAGGFPVAIFSGQSTCIPTGSPMVPESAQTRVCAT